MVRDVFRGALRDWDDADSAAVLPARKGANAAEVAVAWMAGGLASVAAVVVGSVLAVVFAATLVVALVLAAAALTLLAVTWRVRRPRAGHGAGRGEVIEARKVGHSWVAYGWDQTS